MRRAVADSILFLDFIIYDQFKPVQLHLFTKDYPIFNVLSVIANNYHLDVRNNSQSVPSRIAHLNVSNRIIRNGFSQD